MGERGAKVDHCTIYRWIHCQERDREAAALAVASTATVKLGNTIDSISSANGMRRRQNSCSVRR